MSERIHIVVEPDEKARFRRQAEREGTTLSAWLRDAARRKLAESREDARLDTVEALRAFFAACDEREEGCEPDWDEHERVIEDSRGEGVPRPSRP